jgi:hypothetical protein
MLTRARPNDDPGSALTATEIVIIDRIAARAGRSTANAPTISSYLTEIARLGGYLDRRHDPPPGNMIMSRGWTRLMDIRLGVGLAAQPLVGNSKLRRMDTFKPHRASVPSLRNSRCPASRWKVHACPASGSLNAP